MDNDNTLLRCLATAFCTLVVSVASCTAHQNYLETAVVAKAANPAAVECAFSGTDRQHTAFCIEAAKH
jgi:hypothetical protein